MSFSSGHALIIGIGTYKYEPQKNVPITIYDAKEVAEVLGDEKYCGYPPDQITLLHDSDATRDRIIQELDRLSKQLKPEHTLFFFYSGHGMYGYGEDGSYYLTTHDSKLKEEDSYERVIDSSGISESTLINAINSIKAKRIFLFFNACHSGVFATGTLDGSEIQDFSGGKSPPDRLLKILGNGEGRATITACREHEQSSFVIDDKLTFFGSALIEGLKGKDIMPSEEGCITISNLYSYVHKQVKRLAEKYKKIQEPTMIQIVVGTLPIALHSGSRSHKLRQLVGIFYDKSDQLKNHMRLIDMYEEVCSLFHRLESECYTAMSRDSKRIDKNKVFREDSDLFDDFKSYEESLNLIYQKLKILTNTKINNSQLPKWLNNIDLSHKSLQSSIKKKDLSEFKKATWHIEQIFKDEPKSTNNLLIDTAKLISDDLHYIHQKEIVTDQMLNANQEIFNCINNLLANKKSFDDCIDIHVNLVAIASLIVNYKGELDDLDLKDFFIGEIKKHTDLMSTVTMQEIDLFFLKDWEIIKKDRQSERLVRSSKSIKEDIFKVNKLLKKQGEELIKNIDKLISLKNIMENNHGF